MRIKVTWMDGQEKVYSNLDSAGPDKDGMNIHLRETQRIGGPSELTRLIPLANVREVEYLPR